VAAPASPELTALPSSTEAAAPPADPAPVAAAETAPLTVLPRVVVDLTSSSAAPAIELTDEPSDGIIRQLISTAETAPAPRRPPGQIPIDDRPEDTTGEIVTRTGQRAAVGPPAETEPSILVEDLAAEPSALVADLAEAHTAVAAVAAAQAAAPPTPSMATPVTERTVAEVSDDAAEAFSDVEEDFFRAGHEKTAKPPPVHTESFDDLDEGYRPVGFWDRLLGRKPKP